MTDFDTKAVSKTDTRCGSHSGTYSSDFSRFISFCKCSLNFSILLFFQMFNVVEFSLKSVIYRRAFTEFYRSCRKLSGVSDFFPAALGRCNEEFSKNKNNKLGVVHSEKWHSSCCLSEFGEYRAPVIPEVQLYVDNSQDSCNSTRQLGSERPSRHADDREAHGKKKM